MPICPTCGKYVEDGVETCSCGTHFIVSDEDKIKAKYTKEEKLVELYRDYEAMALESYENGNYERAINYATKAINLDLGSDAQMKYVRGKSLYHQNRFYDTICAFRDYISEYENSFYRFSNISGAYHWKARAQWQLGDGFGSIKSYYKALDYVEKKNGSNDYKNQIRFQIREEKQSVINASKGHGIANPRFGEIDYPVYERLEKYREDLHWTMQSLYDAIDEVEAEGYSFDSMVLRDNVIYVIFKGENSTIEKVFDGSNKFQD